MTRLKADTVLLFSGLDPSGAAGVSADIETINQFGVTPLPIITTLTAQNTQRVLSLEPTKNTLSTNVDATNFTSRCFQHSSVSSSRLS